MDLPEQMVQHLGAVAVDYQNGVFAGATDAVQSVTGSAPMTVQAFVEANKATGGD